MGILKGVFARSGCTALPGGSAGALTRQVPILPLNQNPLGALPARFRRQRLLVIGFGDVAQRVAALQAAARAQQRGPRVLALNRDPARTAAIRALQVTPLLGDLDVARSLRRLAGLATRVLHLAPPAPLPQGQPGWSQDGRSVALAQALRRGTAPQVLVYGSTSGVYGDCAGDWVAETRSVAPVNARALRRVHAEQILRGWGRASASTSPGIGAEQRGFTRINVLRIPGIYAPDRKGGTPRARLLRGTPVLRPQDDVFTNHIHADDLARALWRALWRGRPQRVYHVSDDTQMRMGAYFEFAAALYGLPAPEKISRAQAQAQLPATLLSFMGESRRLRNQRLKRELGLVLRYPTVAQGLVDAD